MAGLGKLGRDKLRLGKLKQSIAALRRGEEGGVYILTALVLPVFLVLTGSALDTAELYRGSVNFKAAVDAATLQATRIAATTGDNVRASRRGKEVYQANISNLKGATGDISFDFGSGDCRTDGIVATAHMNHEVFFGLGYSSEANALTGVPRTYQMNGSQTVKCELDTLEIALIVDTSASMMNPPSKLSTLKSASSAMINDLFDKAKNIAIPDPVRFSIIPFASMVNVGPENRDAAWMDNTGQAWFHNENFNWDQNPDYEKFGPDLFPGYRHKVSKQPVTRFTLYDHLNVPWKGCVEMQPYPLHTLDIAYSSTRFNSKIVPSFAPDGPDNWTAHGKSEETYANNYLNDAWNYVPTSPWAPNALSESNLGSAEGVQYLRHKWTGKYLKKDNGTRPTVRNVNILGRIPGGPNLFCDSQPLTPLSGDRSLLLSKINTLRAEGGTMIQAGLGWGWKSLSSDQPLAEGRTYSAENNKKIAILMTDGENNYIPINYYSNFTGQLSNYVRSYYGNFGEAANGRILYPDMSSTATNPATHTLANYRTVMDLNLARTCANMKKKDIILYTIAFEVREGTSIKDILQECASSDETGEKLYFDAESPQALELVFESITRDLAELSVALK